MFKKILILALALSPFSAAFADTPSRVAKEYARVVYDVAVDGGSSTTHTSAVTLPAGFVITDIFLYVNSVFKVSSGSASVALQCSGTRDLMDYQNQSLFAQDYVIGKRLLPNAMATTSLIGVDPGASVALNAGVGSVPTDCQIATIIRSDAGYVPLTGGKFTAIIEYFRK